MTTILITGGNGFVGRQVVKDLQESDVSLRLILRENTRTEFSDVLITADLFSEDAAFWEKACEGVDIIIHLAWYVEPGKYLSSDKNIDCLQGTLQLAMAAAKAGVRRFIGVGTCFEYDLTAGDLSVDTALLPLTPYAGAKVATYSALSSWLPTAGVEFAWCRLFYLYGEGENENRLVPYLRKQIEAGKPVELTSGTQIRDFLDVAIAGKQIADIALSSHQGAVNVCSGIPITVRELVEQIADEYGRRDLLKFGAREDNLTDPPRVVGARPI